MQGRQQEGKQHHALRLNEYLLLDGATVVAIVLFLRHIWDDFMCRLFCTGLDHSVMLLHNNLELANRLFRKLR